MVPVVRLIPTSTTRPSANAAPRNQVDESPDVDEELNDEVDEEVSVMNRRRFLGGGVTKGRTGGERQGQDVRQRRHELCSH